MDTARQVLRFSIPGSVTLMIGTAYLILGRLFQGDSWTGIQSAVAENVSAAVVIFAAIPLGFLIYQVYYSSYRAFVWPWPWRWSRGDQWVRIDRGAQVLKDLPGEHLKKIEDTFEVELEVHDRVLRKVTHPIGLLAHAYVLKHEYDEEAKMEGKRPYDRYKLRWQKHWNVVRALLEISAECDSGSAIRSEYTILSDLYHAIGACRTGVLLAGFTSIFASLGYVIAGGSGWGFLWSFLSTIVLGNVFFFVLHRARGNTWASAQAGLTVGLTGLFNRRPDLLEVGRNPGTSCCKQSP